MSAPETMARTAATAACRLGASAVTTLMMVPAVCALAMLADLHHAAWLAAAAKVTGSETDRSRARPGPQNAVYNHGVL